MIGFRTGPIASKREPTITLINIVFLMLVFFMVAGTIAQPLDGDVKLVHAEALEGREPPDALVVLPDGRLRFREAGVPDAVSYVSALPAEARETVRLVPDRALPARALVKLAEELRAAGAGRVMIVTERGLQ